MNSRLRGNKNDETEKMMGMSQPNEICCCNFMEEVGQSFKGNIKDVISRWSTITTEWFVTHQVTFEIS